ncbi:MAG: histidinol-phosphatase [bacterium]|nr:histidinol-phosphatase [bacterium]
MYQNLHTHTSLCHHAVGKPVDMAKVAVAAGATCLGISDHAALPDDRWLDVRMEYAQLPLYEQWIEEARQAYPQLNLLKGFEAEGDPALFGYYRDLLEGRGFDYLVGAGHYLSLEGQWRSSFSYLQDGPSLKNYVKQLVGMMESGLFAFIAHPDLFGCGFSAWNADLAAASADIAQVSKALGVPLEINGNGWRKLPVSGAEGPRAPYPWVPFWEVCASHQAPVVVNSDAHRPEELFHGIERGRQLASQLGLPLWDATDLGLAKTKKMG